MTDSLAAVIAAVKAAIPAVYISDELPASASLEARLPIIQVVDVPGGSTHLPWQSAAGPLTDVASFDFYVMDRSRERSRDLAARLRTVIFSLAGDAALGCRRVVEESAFSRTPDWNDRVRREHGEYTFHLRAASV